MKTNGSARQRVGGRWVGVIAAVLLGWFFFIPFIGEDLTNRSYDVLLNYRSRIHVDDVLVVSLDTKSGQKLGQGTKSSWDRTLYAQLLRRLKEDGSRTVVIDLVFDESSTNDAAFAAAIREHGKVVLSSASIPSLATNAAALGVERVYPDTDNAVRHLFTARKISNEVDEVAFTWKAAELEGAPVTRRPGARYRFSRWLNYYGPPWSTNDLVEPAIRNLTFYEALRDAPAGFFNGKVVLIGPPSQIGSIGAGKDTFTAPVKSGKIEFAGVEVHATILANLLRSEWLNATMPQQALVLGVFGVAIGLFLVRFKPRIATALAFVSAIVVIALACVSAWYLRFWFPWLTMVLFQIPAALGWALIYHWLQGQLDRQFLEQSLSMYLSPKLVKKFSTSNDAALLKPGATKQKLTIMFSDIAGFTSISEGMDSDELARMMNEYFERAVGGCVHQTDGTVVKYIGDAIFAFWNAPEPQTDHALRACDAALKFRAMSAAEVRGKKLITRIGLHTGVANVGNFGSATRVDYTAIGEDVNLASRMEGLNKYLGTNVLMTGAVKQEIGDKFVTRYLGRFQLKGFERAVEVHELLGKAEETTALIKAQEDFSHALSLFQSRDLNAAETVFRRLYESAPHDGSTQFYLRHITELREHGLPQDWQGEVELKEK